MCVKNKIIPISLIQHPQLIFALSLLHHHQLFLLTFTLTYQLTLNFIHRHLSNFTLHYSLSYHTTPKLCVHSPILIYIHSLFQFQIVIFFTLLHHLILVHYFEITQILLKLLKTYPLNFLMCFYNFLKMFQLNFTRLLVYY